MTIWSGEIKELEKLYESLKGNLPDLEKEFDQLIKTQDANVVMLYSRRCLEVIITDLCECELKRPRKTEPLKGIIDKLNSEEKVPSHIITSMHSLNSLSTYGTHPKDFDPEQVKPVLNNLSIVIKWYLKYRESRIDEIQKDGKGKAEFIGETSAKKEIWRPKKNRTVLLIVLFLAIFLIIGGTIFYFVKKQSNNLANLEKSIAILPFRNDSSDDSTRYFIDGVMEELLTRLQALSDIRIISRTSVEQYRENLKTIPEIAAELGVNYIVEGSGQKSGKSFRLRIQLIRAKKESHLWAKSFERENLDLREYFNTQSQFAEEIAGELNVAITPQEKKLIQRIPTEKLDAYEAYLKGQFYWRKLTSDGLETAFNYFERAKDIDPNYALAYAGICDVWVGRQQAGFSPPEEAGPKAVEAAMKALELDSTRAEVHYTMALITTWGMWDWKEGETAFKKAIRLNPNHAEARAYYSQLLIMAGKTSEGMKEIEIAIQLDPYNPLIKGLYSMNLYMVHRFDEGIIAARDALKLDPNSLIAQSVIGDNLVEAGRYKEAIENYKLAFKLFGYEDINPKFDIGYSKSGFKGAFKEVAETLVEISKYRYVLPLLICNCYIYAGEKKNAIYWLEKMYELHDPNLPYFLVYPLFDPLRDEPSYQEIAKKMNLPPR